VTAFHTSITVWGIWFALTLGSFLTLELLGLSDRVGWNSLTWTIRQLFARNQLWGLAFAAALVVFAVHLFWTRDKKNDPEGRN